MDKATVLRFLQLLLGDEGAVTHHDGPDGMPLEIANPSVTDDELLVSIDGVDFAVKVEAF